MDTKSNVEADSNSALRRNLRQVMARAFPVLSRLKTRRFSPARWGRIAIGSRERTRPRLLLFLLALSFALAWCQYWPEDALEAQGLARRRAVTHPGGTGKTVYDCMPETGCLQLSVSGDPVDTSVTSGFYGNLDPTMRRDPNGNHTLYFMYSFPLVVRGANTPAIEIHLASSSDHGATWKFVTNVWPYVKQANGNYSSHEVSNLAAQSVNGTTTWYAISHYYEVPPGGSAANPHNALYVEPVFTESTYYVLSRADDPAQLASPSDSQILICGGTTSAYASLSSPNLTAISGDSGAVTWREPALMVQGDILYLVAQAATANGTFEYLGVFAAQTTGRMPAWNWKYLGKLFEPTDPAQALPSASRPVFTEIDLTQKANGQIVAIMTAMDLTTQQKYGSRTADVATLGTYSPVTPPTMVRDAAGHLIFTGQFTANDLNVPPNQGPGASTYEAMEPDVGLLIARRGIQPNVHGFTFDTGQHPQ